MSVNERAFVPRQQQLVGMADTHRYIGPDSRLISDWLGNYQDTG